MVTPKNISVERDDTCQIACYLKNDCLSYNVGRLKDGSFICELSDSDSNQYPQDLEEAPRIYFSRNQGEMFYDL